MKTPTRLLSLTLSLVAAGCIATKDVGVESDASSGGSSSQSSGASSTSGASMSSTSVDTASGTATTTTAGGSDSSTGPSAVGASTGGSDAGSGTSAGGSDSSSVGDTETFAEQPQCEDSGGIWDVKSCGHYTCGLLPDCDAVVPGCDCGVGSSFVEGPGGGCEPSEECEAVAFSCGPELTCSAPSEFCDVLIPGVKGAETSYSCLDTPDSCSEAYTCGCIGGAGDCGVGPEGGLTVTIAAP